MIPWGRHWLDLVAKEPQLRQPIPGAEDYLLAEARYAASHEGALHLDDILTRRTRISIETWDRGLAAATASCLDIMGPARVHLVSPFV